MNKYIGLYMVDPTAGTIKPLKHMIDSECYTLQEIIPIMQQQRTKVLVMLACKQWEARRNNIVLKLATSGCNSTSGPATVKASPCDASAAPTNGGAGNCTIHLVSGSTCQPTCDLGYTVSGTSRCSRGMLTQQRARSTSVRAQMALLLKEQLALGMVVLSVSVAMATIGCMALRARRGMVPTLHGSSIIIAK